MIKWTEICIEPSLHRYQSLSAELQNCGIANLFEPTQISSANELFATIEKCKKEYSQIRIASEFAEKTVELYPDLPADVVPLRAVDALVPETHPETKIELTPWWGRCFYFDGLIRSLVRDQKNLDLIGGVFIMGATWEARILVAAFARIGFNKVLISDVDESRGQNMVRELTRTNFGVTFQFVQKSMVTQLPGTCSLATNLLSLVEHPEIVADLSYLNFLRPDGVWLDTKPYGVQSPIVAEALSLGTQVEPGIHLISNVDEAWAERCFKVKIDLLRYRQLLESKREKA